MVRRGHIAALFGLFTFFVKTVTFLETFNTAGGVDKLLFAGEKRMAGGTEFQADIGLCGTGFKLVATGAADSNGVILGMYSFFHYQPLFNIYKRLRITIFNGLFQRNNFGNTLIVRTRERGRYRWRID